MDLEPELKQELEPSRSKKPWLLATLLVVLVAAVYLNSLHGVFLFDDEDSIADNATIKSLWRSLKPPAGGATVSGRPMVNFSLALNWAVGRTDVLSYHVVNISLHALAALTLMALVRRTLLLSKWKGRFDSSAGGLAFAAAAVWALHPLQTESVTYIVQRAESIMSLFYLLTMYCSLRAITDEKLSRRWEATAIAVCAAGMASKEVMVSAPLAVVLFDRFFLFESFREAFKRRRTLYIGLAVTWIILAFLVITNPTRGNSAGFTGNITVWAYVQTQAVWICRYLAKVVWPATLVLDYGTGLITGFATVWPYALTILLLLSATVLAVRYCPWVGYLAILFWMILAPTSSFVPNVNQTAAEHRMYLPLAPLTVLVVLALAWLWEKLLTRAAVSQDSRWLLGRFVPSALLVTVLLALGIRTIVRNEDYESLERMWTQANRDFPNCARLLDNAGMVCQGKGQYDQALKYFEQSVAIKSDYALSYAGLGDIYCHLAEQEKSQAQRQRLFSLAERNYTKSIELEPYCVSYSNRGVMYLKWGDKHRALDDLTKAVSLSPYHVKSRLNRAIVASELGRLKDARADLDIVLNLAPNDMFALHMRAETLRALGELPQALADVTRAIRLSPTGQLYGTRAHIYFDMNERAKCLEDVRTAREMGSGLPPELERKLGSSNLR